MKYFIDTNIIIDLINKDSEAIEKLSKIASSEESVLYINRLVEIESLRTIHVSHSKVFQNAKNTLNIFEKVDIKQEIYDEAVEFSRFCKSKGVSLKGKCEAIDFIHFITAKHYGLEIVTNDKDFAKLEEQYSKFTSPKP